MGVLASVQVVFQAGRDQGEERLGQAAAAGQEQVLRLLLHRSDPLAKIRDAGFASRGREAGELRRFFVLAWRLLIGFQCAKYGYVKKLQVEQGYKVKVDADNTSRTAARTLAFFDLEVLANLEL
jgi:hypothetical protein